MKTIWNHRLLTEGEVIQEGDLFTSKVNPQDFIITGLISCEYSYGCCSVGKTVGIDNGALNVYRPIPPIKPVKLVRKYRFLKPHEKIQVGDIVYALDTKIEDIRYHESLYRIEIDDISLGKPANSYITLKFARFVDCVPVASEK